MCYRVVLSQNFNIKSKLGWLRRWINWVLIPKSKANGSKHNQMYCSEEECCYHQCVRSAKTFHVPQSRVLHYWFWAHPVPLWLMIHTVWLKWHIHCGAARNSSMSFWHAWAWLYTWSCFVKATRSSEISLWLCSRLLDAGFSIWVTCSQTTSVLFIDQDCFWE